MRLFVLLLCLSACASEPVPETAPLVAARAASSLDVDHWIQGEAPEAERVVVVFWELWCPHCRRELPKLEAMSTSLDLPVVAATRLSRDVAEADVVTFLQENSVTVPAVVGGHELASTLGIRGVPAAAILEGDTVLWQGHPARLTQDVVAGLPSEGSTPL